MTRLTLSLLGPGVLTVDGVAVRTHSARTLGLLAYLVLEAGRPHARASLAALVWDGWPEAAARQNLRQALYSLRTLAQGRLASCLQVDPAWIEFTPDAQGAAVDIDVQRFLAGVRSTDEARWREASTLYKAALLEGRDLDACEAFRAWLTTAREGLHALAMHNLGRLVVGHLARSQGDAAAGFARAMRELDPTSELAAQHLLKIAAHTRQPQAMAVPVPGTPLHPPLRATGDVESTVRAGQAAERVYAFSQAAELYGRALELIRRSLPASAQRCCDVLLLHEAMLERLGRRADQASAIDEALSIAQALGDPPRVAAILLRRTGAQAYLGRHDDARRAAEQALAIFRQLGDQPGEAEALRELGFVSWHAEDHPAALQHARDALALHRRMGDITGEATALHNLAEIHRGLGSPGLAMPWFEQALRLHWAAGNPLGEILSLFGWAHALQQAGDLPASKQKYEGALALAEQQGERAMQSRALHALAMQHVVQGELDPALAFMRRVIEVDRAIGYAHALGHDLVDLSRLHGVRGERAQARVALQEALVWFDYTEDAHALALVRTQLEQPAGHGDPPALTALADRRRHGVKSHLALGEGKVYCEFESPLARQARG